MDWPYWEGNGLSKANNQSSSSYRASIVTLMHGAQMWMSSDRRECWMKTSRNCHLAATSPLETDRGHASVGKNLGLPLAMIHVVLMSRFYRHGIRNARVNIGCGYALSEVRS